MGRDQVMSSPDADCIDAVINKPTTPSKILDAVMEAHAKRQGGYRAQRSLYAPPRAAKRLQGLRMLLTEDNFINQQVARGILETEGAVIVTADNGRVALDLLERQPGAFDLVLMDVQMPVMDGLEATRRIRGELQLMLPVIAMSAGVTQGERDICASAGMDDFIAKPLDPQVVVQTIARLNLQGARAESPGVADARLPSPLGEVAGIDMPELVVALNGDTASVVRLLQRLEQECGTALTSLGAAIESAAFVELASLLHNFRGRCANMRATEVAVLSERMEQQLRQGGLAEAAADWPALRERIVALQAALRDWKAPT
jgi:CheY-like chemotaxis protein/HPt (histidine-containing phosphotransfer) domain-containing protein